MSVSWYLFLIELTWRDTIPVQPSEWDKWLIWLSSMRCKWLDSINSLECLLPFADLISYQRCCSLARSMKRANMHLVYSLLMVVQISPSVTLQGWIFDSISNNCGTPRASAPQLPNFFPQNCSQDVLPRKSHLLGLAWLWLDFFEGTTSIVAQGLFLIFCSRITPG